MIDSILLEKLKKRSPNSIEHLIEKYNAYVGTIVYNAIGQSASREDIEEVIQDVFVAIWENAKNINDLKSYIGTTARNKALNKLRNITYSSELIEAKDTENEPSVIVEKKEMTRILYEEIEALGEPDNEIFIRYYYNNEKLKDIAEETGCNISTVKSKLKRGKEKLSARLSERRGLR